MATPYGSFQDYGAGPSVAPMKRKKMNLVAISLNILTPWFVFCAVMGAKSFDYTSSLLGWAFVVLGFGVAALAGILAWRSQRTEGDDPKWYTFAALAMFVAVVLASILGSVNYLYNMGPFYDLQNLNVYPSVSVDVDKGQQMMDAGRVYFEAGTTLDTTKAMAFQNQDTYCVTPIVAPQGDVMTSYDFWAVGVNCCPGKKPEFQCGEYRNKDARAGVRLMREDQRPFFRLAVQQAEAAFNLKSEHPLFFTWMQDPVAAMNIGKQAGYKFFLMSIFGHFTFNLFCVACAVVGFSRMGAP